MSVSDLSGLIADFATGTYAVTRATPGAYADGIFVPDAAPTTLQVEACVCPLSGNDLLRLPEGLRSKELLDVFTAVELQVDAPGQRPDVIMIEGHAWQVEKSQRWVPGSFFRATVSKQP